MAENAGHDDGAGAVRATRRREGTRPRHGIGDRDRAAPIDHQRAVVEDRAGAEPALRAAVADLQGAGLDHRAAGIIGEVTENRRASAALDEAASAGQDIRQIVDVRPVDGEGASGIDRHHSDNRTGRAAHADLQRAGIDDGAAGIGLIGRKNRGAGAGLHHLAGRSDAVLDEMVETVGIGTVEDQRAVVDDVAGDRTGRAAIADLQRGAIADDGHAGIGIGTGQRQGSRGRDLQAQLLAAVLDHSGKGRARGRRADDANDEQRVGLAAIGDRAAAADAADKLVLAAEIEGRAGCDLVDAVHAEGARRPRLQRAGGDRGQPGIGERHDDQRAGAGLFERPGRACRFQHRSRLGGRAGQHLQLGMVGIEDDRVGDIDAGGIVDDRAERGDGAGTEGSAALGADGAAIDRGAARKGIVAAKRQDVRAELGKAAAAGNGTAEMAGEHRRAAVEAECADRAGGQRYAGLAVGLDITDRAA